MAYDIFMSYRRSDQPIAKALVKALEARGVGVWWDGLIEPGVDWRDAIVDNLSESDMLIILFSSECNDSKQLRKELAIADTMDKMIVPILIEETKPKGHFLYELAARNWVEAFPDPHTKIEELATHLQAMAAKGPGGLQGANVPSTVTAPAPATGAPRASVPDPVQKVSQKATKKKKADKKRRDLLPFKWIDILFLVPLIGLSGYHLTDGMFADMDIPNIALWSTLILGFYGGLLFPIRYFMRRRRVWRALGMYLLSSLVLFALSFGVFIWGTTTETYDMSELGDFVLIFGGAWVVFCVAAFIIYSILNAQRAVRNMRKNTTKI